MNEYQHPCTVCQRRKVKCDRLSPCTNCLTHGYDCTKPESRRAPRKSRRKNDSSVLDRLRQLEDTLEKMRAQSALGIQQHDVPSPERMSGTGTRESAPKEEDPGHLVIQDDQSRYVSGSSWANLAEKISEIKVLLNSDDEPESDDEPSSTRLLSQMESVSHSLPVESSRTMFPFLWEIYKQKIDPIMKVLHIPSMQSQFLSTLSDPNQLPKGMTSLVAAIKFAAVLSLRDEQCWAAMGYSRQTLLSRFRADVHQTLNDSNFLTSHDLVSLQAYVIFLSCNIRHEPHRAMWISSGVMLRLAQSMGLHRDGLLMKLPIFATEMRRRLWWQIRMLEIASAEDSGFLPTHVYGEDVLLPLNINDEDISQTNTTWPSEKECFTEMTYSLIRFEICNRLHGFRSENGKTSMGILTGDKGRIGEQSRALAECRAYIDAKFLRHCRRQVPLQRTANAIGNVILSKACLIIHYPLLQSQRNLGHVSKDLINKLFVVSCNVIEPGHELILDPETYAYTWQYQTYVHWHPVAFLLREFCTLQMSQEQMIRAWRAVTLAISDPHGLEPEPNRALWKPLDGLISRAKAKIQALNLDIDCDSITTQSQNSTNLEKNTGFQIPFDEMQEWLAPVDQNLFPLDLNTPLVSYLPSDDFMAESIDPHSGFDILSWIDDGL